MAAPPLATEGSSPSRGDRTALSAPAQPPQRRSVSADPGLLGAETQISPLCCGSDGLLSSAFLGRKTANVASLGFHLHRLPLLTFDFHLISRLWVQANAHACAPLTQVEGTHVVLIQCSFLVIFLSLHVRLLHACGFFASGGGEILITLKDSGSTAPSVTVMSSVTHLLGQGSVTRQRLPAALPPHPPPPPNRVFYSSPFRV